MSEEKNTPNLLAALKHLIADIELTVGQDWDHWQSVIAAREAIAKAEGVSK